MAAVAKNAFEIKVPASIANLGPGFDTLAVAVRLYLTLHVRAEPHSRGVLNFKFRNCQLQGENYIERAFGFLARQRTGTLPSLSIEVESDIPMRSGLGSSAAATVAGIRLFDAVAGPLSPNEMLNVATALEGHPDNVAAALLGGLTSSCQLPDGSSVAAQFPWPRSLRLLVLVPEHQLSTRSSREALPSHYKREDAVYNLQRIVLLLSALQNRDYSLLREALQDRLHQPYRKSLVPGLEELLSLEHPDLLGVCLAGAGPSVVAFTTRNSEAVARTLRKAYACTGVKCRVLLLDAHQDSMSQKLPRQAYEPV
jgi:homoserine kinase